MALYLSYLQGRRLACWAALSPRCTIVASQQNSRVTVPHAFNLNTAIQIFLKGTNIRINRASIPPKTLARNKEKYKKRVVRRRCDEVAVLDARLYSVKVTLAREID